MKRIKILNSFFDEKIGISTSIIKTELGIFIGEAKLNEKDRPFASKIVGCQYAEIRAIIKYLKAKKHIIHFQINKYEKENTIEAKKQLFLLRKKQKMITNQINSLHQKIFLNIRRRAKINSLKTKGDEK